MALPYVLSLFMCGVLVTPHSSSTAAGTADLERAVHQVQHPGREKGEQRMETCRAGSSLIRRCRHICCLLVPRTRLTDLEAIVAVSHVYRHERGRPTDLFKTCVSTASFDSVQQ